MATNEYFKDKICIVTGANSGIGYALSEELLKRGATVYMLGRSPEKVAKAAEQLAAHGDRVHTLVADVAKQEQVEHAIEGAAAEAGRLDMLFNNAGISFFKPFETVTSEDRNAIMDTNLWSVVFGTTAAVPIMLKQGSGHIVNTGSVGGLLPGPFQSLYVLTKSAIIWFSEALRYEYAEKGLHFSVFCPGDIATPIFAKLGGAIPADALPADEAVSYVLDRVADHQGIIVVPEQPWTDVWRGYALGKKEILDLYVQSAHERRVQLEKGRPE